MPDYQPTLAEVQLLTDLIWREDEAKRLEQKERWEWYEAIMKGLVTLNANICSMIRGLSRR